MTKTPLPRTGTPLCQLSAKAVHTGAFVSRRLYHRFEDRNRQTSLYVLQVQSGARAKPKSTRPWLFNDSANFQRHQRLPKQLYEHGKCILRCLLCDHRIEELFRFRTQVLIVHARGCSWKWHLRNVLNTGSGSSPGNHQILIVQNLLCVCTCECHESSARLILVRMHGAHFVGRCRERENMLPTLLTISDTTRLE